MKIRRLQRKDENGQWYDDAYVYEDEVGQVIFCCNLTWESVGRHYYRKFKESGLPIENVETVLSLDGQTMRWLPVEHLLDLSNGERKTKGEDRGRKGFGEARGIRAEVG